MSDLVFTKINDASSFRRAELESVKDILHMLQGFERVSRIRTEKAEKSIFLTKQMKDLYSLISKLKTKLPAPLHEHVQAPAPLPAATGSGKKGNAKTKMHVKAKAGRAALSPEEQRTIPQGITALERQLRDIEGKLNVLS